VLGDTGAVLPVSTLDDSGEFRGVALSRPTRVGRGGWLEHVDIDLSEAERRGLLESAEVLDNTLKDLRAGTSPA
jgi:L-lactate dehydrogenase